MEGKHVGEKTTVACPCSEDKRRKVEEQLCGVTKEKIRRENGGAETRRRGGCRRNGFQGGDETRDDGPAEARRIEIQSQDQSLNWTRNCCVLCLISNRSVTK